MRQIRPINYFQNALGNSELDISLGDSNDFSQLISVPIDDKTDQLLEHVFLGSKIHNDDTMRGYKCVSKDNKSPHYACAICVDQVLGIDSELWNQTDRKLTLLVFATFYQTPCNGYAFRGPASCPTLEFGDSDLDENDLAVFTTRERINLVGQFKLVWGEEKTTITNKSTKEEEVEDTITKRGARFYHGTRCIPCAEDCTR